MNLKDLDFFRKFLSKPKESDNKTYLMPEHEQMALKQIVGEKDFLNNLRAISFQVTRHEKLADDIINIRQVYPLTDNPLISNYEGPAVAWDFKEI